MQNEDKEMKGFPEEVRQSINYSQNGFCKTPGCYDIIIDYHHRLANTAPNRKKYPKFLSSPMNAVGLCRNCHDGSAKEQFKITLKEGEVYEKWLERFLERGA